MSFDRNNSADLTALKNEVTTDPESLGYNPDVTQTGVLDIINAIGVYQVAKPDISSTDVRGATTYDAYDGASIDEQEWLRWITNTGAEPGTDDIHVTADIRQKLAGDPTASQSIWATAERDAMNAAMLALMDVPGSRAEDLFGWGTQITEADWFAARDS